MAEDLPKSKTGGSKLGRSEVTTIRLDQKLRYLAELAARKHRRTLSSYIEWAVENSLRDVKLYEGTGYNNDDSVTLEQEAAALWDVDEAERFIRLAISYPELLTHEEQERWKMLMDSDLLGPAKLRINNGALSWNRSKLEDAVYPVVRRQWPSLVEAHTAGGEATRKWITETRLAVLQGKFYYGYPSKKAGSGFDELSDDIPF
jgi:hypothetical protein